MSDLKKHDDGTLSVSAENARTLTDNPLLAVPLSLRKPVFVAWSMYRHLPGMETSSAISFLVGIWIAEHGVKLEVVREALRMVTSPEAVKGIKFASDLTAMLAQLITPNRSSLPYG